MQVDKDSKDTKMVIEFQFHQDKLLFLKIIHIAKIPLQLIFIFLIRKLLGFKRKDLLDSLHSRV